MSIRISASREMPDVRLFAALDQPHRRGSFDPLDVRAECPLGRLRLSNRITDAEYSAGCRWRTIYLNWLGSIGAPNPFPAAVDIGGADMQEPLDLPYIDEEMAEVIAKAFRTGEAALKKLGARVFHAVNAVAVYEEVDDLGGLDSTFLAARRGLSVLADQFGMADGVRPIDPTLTTVIAGEKVAQRDGGEKVKLGKLSSRLGGEYTYR